MHEFIKNPANPIYGGPETGTLFDVYVQNLNGRYRMDFSWRPEGALAVAFSDDGIHWTAPRMTLPSNPDSGWEDKVNRNCVVKVNDCYKMWYTGQARGYSFIGMAESDDGLDFHRSYSQPVLIPERHWEGMSVMNPCVLYDSGIYRMWYAAGETYEPNVLAYAESSDGINWQKSRINPIYVADKRHDYERDRVGGCQVLPHRELGYLMFYIGYRDIHTACVCVAASPDGVTRWRRYRGNPIAMPTAGMWDADSCYKPSALYDIERKCWRVWYNGRHGHDEYIGEISATGDFCDDDFE